MRRKHLLLIGMLIMGFVILSNIGITNALASTTNSNPSVSYATHVQDIGWQTPVKDGAMSGTEGQSKRLEAIKISVGNVQGLGVQYSTHVQDIGWQAPVSDGAMSGTQGQSKRLEAIKIQLTGVQAQNFDIYYRVHAETYGWMNWVKNGDIAGTTGQSKRLEAIEIVIVPKGSTSPANTTTSDLVWPNPSVTYTTHVQDYGWLPPVADGALSGKDAEGKRIEAVQISLKNARYSGGISYKTQVQDYGWLNSVSDGAISGTTGQGKRAEAIQVNLTGEMANHYDVYYRVESQDYGWLDWAENGQSAGTVGLSKQMEAIEIVLVQKGGAAPGPTVKPLITNLSVVYSSQVQDIGWQNSVLNGALSGTVGQSKRLEAIKIALQNVPYSGGITYASHVQDYGWMSSVSNGAVSGTVGQGKRMEAININLTGDIANYFDVYYRVNIELYGWLGWAKDGMNAGSVGLSKRIEAIEIKLVPKGQGDPVDANQAFLQPKQSIYTTTNYNYTLSYALGIQMGLSTPPQTSLYTEYVRADELTQDANGNWIVSGSKTTLQNVYSGPGTTNSIVGTINGGNSVTVLQTITTPGQPTWYKISAWINATSQDVLYDMNPLNFTKGSDGYFQFLKLSEPAGLNADEVNQKILNGKGILQGMASSFIQAGNQYGVNEIYLISHALMETGNGTSDLAIGVHVNVANGVVSVIDKTQWQPTDTIVYNMYGIGAVDSNALQGGAQTAYNNQWFTPQGAIIGGAQYIAANYIDKGQDTLYKMRWNPTAPGTHQYATDDQWAINQVSSIKSLYDLISSYVLVFDAPQYQ